MSDTEPAGAGRPEGPPPDGLREVPADLRQRLIERAEAGLALLSPERLTAGGAPRVTILVLTKDRAEDLERLLVSLVAHLRIPAKLLLIDDASQPKARAAVAARLETLREQRSSLAEIHAVWHDTSIGCSRSRQFAVGIVDTELLLFFDDDTEILPGSIEHLVQALDHDPSALAAGGHLLLPDGTTQLCGGEFLEEPAGVLVALPWCMGLDFEDPELGESGPSEWLAGAGVLFRTDALVRHPLDPQLDHYYEDTEWFYRVGRAHPPGAFRRVVESKVLHYQRLKGPKRRSPDDILLALPYLTCLAHFYRRHGLVLDGAFHFAPRLLTREKRDVAAARLLLELLAECGPEWVARQWLAGLLEPVFSRGALQSELEGVRTELAVALEYQVTLANALGRAESALQLAQQENLRGAVRAQDIRVRLLSGPFDPSER